MIVPDLSILQTDAGDCVLSRVNIALLAWKISKQPGNITH